MRFDSQFARMNCQIFSWGLKRWPKDKITLRNRTRVIEQSWRE
jgi:hypothetical protein